MPYYEEARCEGCGLKMRVLGEESTCSQCGKKLCLGCSDGDAHRDREGHPSWKATGPCREEGPFDAIRNFDTSALSSAIDRAETWAENIETVVLAQRCVIDAFKRHHDCANTGHVFEVDAMPSGGLCVSCGADIEELERSDLVAYVAKCEKTAGGASHY